MASDLHQDHLSVRNEPMKESNIVIIRQPTKLISDKDPLLGASSSQPKLNYGSSVLKLNSAAKPVPFQQKNTQKAIGASKSTNDAKLNGTVSDHAPKDPHLSSLGNKSKPKFKPHNMNITSLKLPITATAVNSAKAPFNIAGSNIKIVKFQNGSSITSSTNVLTPAIGLGSNKSMKALSGTKPMNFLQVLNLKNPTSLTKSSNYSLSVEMAKVSSQVSPNDQAFTQTSLVGPPDESVASGGNMPNYLATYVCRVEGCERMFNSAGSLKRHTKSHSTGHFFICPQKQCGAAFSSSYLLLQHRLQHDKHEQPADKLSHILYSDNTSFPCSFRGCPVRCPTATTLVRHLSACHRDKSSRGANSTCEANLVVSTPHGHATAGAKEATLSAAPAALSKATDPKLGGPPEDSAAGGEEMTSPEAEALMELASSEFNLVPDRIKSCLEDLSPLSPLTSEDLGLTLPDPPEDDTPPPQTQKASGPETVRSLLKTHRSRGIAMSALVPLTCPALSCRARFEEMGDVRAHCCTLHPGLELPDVIKCKFGSCGKKFWDATTLEAHFAADHTGDKPFKCPVSDCVWAFKVESGLKKHLDTHTLAKSFKCEECGKSLSTAYNLEIHKRLHTRPKDLCCVICGQETDTLRSLGVHLKTHGTSGKLFRCPVPTCDKSFATPVLRSHLRTHGTEGGDGLTCTHPGCGRVFDLKCRLRAHMMVHSTVRPYLCPVKDCGWAFREQGKLKRHLLKHSSERPYECDAPHCGKRFGRADHLKSHKLMHAESRPHKCTWPGCAVSLSTASGLRKHVEGHKRKALRQRSAAVVNTPSLSAANNASLLHLLAGGSSGDMTSPMTSSAPSVTSLVPPPLPPQQLQQLQQPGLQQRVGVFGHEGGPGAAVMIEEAVQPLTLTPHFPPHGPVTVNHGPVTVDQALLELGYSDEKPAQAAIDVTKISVTGGPEVMTSSTPGTTTLDLSHLHTSASAVQPDHKPASFLPSEILTRRVGGRVVGRVLAGGEGRTLLLAGPNMAASPQHRGDGGGLLNQERQFYISPEDGMTGSARTDVLCNERLSVRAKRRQQLFREQGLTLRLSTGAKSGGNKAAPAHLTSSSSSPAVTSLEPPFTTTSSASGEAETSRGFTLRDLETGATYVQTQILQDEEESGYDDMLLFDDMKTSGLTSSLLMPPPSTINLHDLQ